MLDSKCLAEWGNTVIANLKMVLLPLLESGSPARSRSPLPRPDRSRQRRGAEQDAIRQAAHRATQEAARLAARSAARAQEISRVGHRNAVCLIRLSTWFVLWRCHSRMCCVFCWTCAISSLACVVDWYCPAQLWHRCTRGQASQLRYHQFIVSASTYPTVQAATSV